MCSSIFTIITVQFFIFWHDPQKEAQNGIKIYQNHQSAQSEYQESTPPVQSARTRASVGNPPPASLDPRLHRKRPRRRKSAGPALSSCALVPLRHSRSRLHDLLGWKISPVGCSNPPQETGFEIFCEEMRHEEQFEQFEQFDWRRQNVWFLVSSLVRLNSFVNFSTCDVVGVVTVSLDNGKRYRHAGGSNDFNSLEVSAMKPCHLSRTWSAVDAPRTRSCSTCSTSSGPSRPTSPTSEGCSTAVAMAVRGQERTRTWFLVIYHM